MKKVMKKIIGLSVLAGLSANAFAEAGQSTLSVGYAHSDLKYSDSRKADDTNTVNVEARERHVSGFNVKYRYEFTDQWGAITSFTHAQTSGTPGISLNGEAIKDASASYKLQYNSLMIGSTYRVNDWVSLYGMVGASNGRVHLHADKNVPGVQDSARRHSENKYAVAWSAGLQVNPLEQLAVDLSFEQSNPGEMKANTVVLGLGYTF
ncbi:Ail/Lom family outer membrane beta-barrel protein [Candidatus Regiella endosymbiont of Tuberolachnus salignus]|uniref:Ail/Lom family outer membrane beta-barrel protein n=1 Tax=Candidatus Regiella endosymbiont of Tuberolachnus salignus TaxID=3077956 RepID=UPI0030D483DA